MKWLLIILGVAGGLYYIGSQGDIEKKREYLKNVNVYDNDWIEVVKRFTASEVETVYEFMTKYSETNPVPSGSELQQKLIEISSKYNIFT